MQEKPNKKTVATAKVTLKDLDDETMKLAAYYIGLYFIKGKTYQKNLVKQQSFFTKKNVDVKRKLRNMLGEIISFSFLQREIPSEKY